MNSLTFRSRAPALRALLVSLLVAATALPASSARADTSTPLVVGGARTTIERVPWQVALVLANPSALCGGSILGPRTVLTAAHCVVPPGRPARKPADFKVLAGFSDLNAYQPGSAPPAGSQVVAVSAVRVHPYYQQATKVDDVAVLTLAKALNLSGPRAKPIALAPVGAGPAPGSAVGISGYGQQDPSRDADGKLYAATMATLSDDACRDHLVGRSAVVMCAQASTSAPCSGDSGGAVTAGDAQVGVVSFAPEAGCGSGPSGMAEVTAPEVRAFIDGAAAIPTAPQESSVAVINTVLPPVVGSPVTCQPGTWSGAPSFGYLFQTEDAAPAALQAGPSNVYVPQPRDVGRPIVCVLQASNGGGTGTQRTGITPPVAADAVAPRAAIRSVICRRRTCKLTLQAVDPNSQGALRVAVSARYRACRRKRRCDKTRGFAVARVGPTTFRATAKRLPYRRLRLRVRVSDAAGNHARTRRARARPHPPRRHRAR